MDRGNHWKAGIRAVGGIGKVFRFSGIGSAVIGAGREWIAYPCAAERWPDRKHAVDSKQEERGEEAAVESSAVGVFTALHKAKHCPEGAAAWNHDLHSRALLHSYDHAAGNDHGPGRAQPGCSRGNF